jgi:hypothetical protein
VVDAMNVIGSRPDGWWREREAAIERLVGRLERWAEDAGERVTVVLEKPPRRPIRGAGVEVISAADPGRDAADREILARLDGWLADDRVTIVTSDRDLADRARATGAEVERAGAFRRRLEEGTGD